MDRERALCIGNRAQGRMFSTDAYGSASAVTRSVTRPDSVMYCACSGVISIANIKKRMFIKALFIITILYVDVHQEIGLIGFKVCGFHALE